jgi:hypothetical protein
MWCLLLTVVAADVDEISPSEVSKPQERAVRFKEPGDYFAARSLVRLVPVKVGKVKTNKGTVDTIKAKCLDPNDPFLHRWILASDFEEADLEWFTREAARLWKSQSMEEKAQVSP